MGYILKFYDRLITVTMKPEKMKRLTAQDLKQIQAMTSDQLLATKGKLARSLLRLKKEPTVRLHVKNHCTVLQLLYSLCEQYEDDNVYKDPLLKDLLIYVKLTIQDLKDFLDQRFPSFLPEFSATLTEGKNSITTKIHSKLSVDQLALILRAAFDQGMIISKSMNNLFRSIVPYLSTTERSQLSFGSMRSKSYNAESKDKNETIAILQELIKLISSY